MPLIFLTSCVLDRIYHNQDDRYMVTLIQLLNGTVKTKLDISCGYPICTMSIRVTIMAMMDLCYIYYYVYYTRKLCSSLRSPVQLYGLLKNKPLLCCVFAFVWYLLVYINRNMVKQRYTRARCTEYDSSPNKINCNSTILYSKNYRTLFSTLWNALKSGWGSVLENRYKV